jgi:acetolactate synthase-1/2/3 large subunit
VNLTRRSALGWIGTATALAGSARAQDLPPATPPPGSLPLTMHEGPPAGTCVRGRMTGARAVVEALCVEGTRCVFGVPGAQSNELWDAFKTHGLPYLLVTNESSASIMADASARATGVPGVFSVVPGPGITNALTGIGEALYDSVPIVGIVTDIDRRPGAPIGQVHGLANAAILRPVCKAVLEVPRVEQIAAAVHQAFRIARCGEPGPTAVVIPYYMFTEVAHFDEPAPYELATPFDEAGYRKALRLLCDRKLKVGFYMGQGCQDATASVAAAAEMLQAPVATSVSGKGAVPDRHPLAVGWGYGPQGTRAAEKTFAEDVDMVLAVGVRFSENSTANFSLPGKERLIHVDANPNNLGKNVPADAVVQADSRVFLERLLADGAAIQRQPDPALWRRIGGRRAADRASYHQVQVCDGVDPMWFLTHLNRCLGPDALLFVDVTASVHWAAEAVEVAGPRRFFTPANNQGMGWSVPAAIGAQRVRPEARVAAVTGDGCFLMSGLEASTAARTGLPVKFFVLDDGTYHYMQMLQEPTFRRTTATEIARLDFAGLAAGLGLAYQSINSNAEVGAGLSRAMATPGPVLTSVRISYEGREIRWMEALKTSYIDRMGTRQKVRMGTRVVARTLIPGQVND